MLKINPPLRLGSATYTHKVVRLIQIDLPHRAFNFVLSVAREEQDYIHIGMEEYSAETGRNLVLPEITMPWGIQPNGLGEDSTEVQRLLAALRPFLKEVETIIEESQYGVGGLAEQEQKLGEDRFHLQVRRVSAGGKPVTVRKIQK